MKKLFVYVMASLCCTFAFADADLVVKDVAISGGTGTMEVVINKANTTAFQFDLKLPTGISATGFTLAGAPSTRHFENAVYNAETNTYRFLSYDNENAALSEGAIFNIALAAADGATTSEAETENILLVDPDGASTEVEGATANISMETKISITSEQKEMTTYVSNTGLDFTGNEAKAYVVTGIEGNNVWMTRIYKVPAGTAIVVKGSVGNHYVKTADISGIYYKNFLCGNNTDEKISVTPEGDDQYYYFGSSNGFTPFTSTHDIGAHKAYLRFSKLPATAQGSDVSVTIKDKVTSLCANVDLDFTGRTDGLKAYIASGYDGSVWLTPVTTASAGTALYIKGAAGNYTITSKATQTVYANMMKGNNSDEKITINKIDGDYTNYFVSSSGFNTFSTTKDISAHKSYLQVLTSCLPAESRGISDGTIFVGENEVETLCISLGSLGGDDDETTDIRSIGEVQLDDVWYNLKGQRIDTPTKKGLYIKNGKKVVVR